MENSFFDRGSRIRLHLQISNTEERVHLMWRHIADRADVEKCSFTCFADYLAENQMLKLHY